MSDSKIKVAIQGFEASFHQIAAFKYFGRNIDTIMCSEFRELFQKVHDKKVDFAVAAIENTVSCTLLPNYSSLRDTNSFIIGEVYLRIKQNLMSLPGQKISELKEVHSHPIALLQCHKFFKNYPNIKLIESPDTALSAKRIRENNLKNVAAIASFEAAKIYELDVLAESIETNKKNFTRFLIIQEKSKVNKIKNPNKASICFNLAHKTGSLANILVKFAEMGVNLTKIQSLPILGKEWEYFFHLDLVFSNLEKYQRALKNIQSDVNELKVLGEYKKGEKVIYDN